MKIRCKKCSTVIVVDGLAGVVASVEGAAPHADDHAAAVEHPTAEAAPSTWTVSVDEADQRTLDVAGIVELYGSGVIDDATFVWHDGMEDWKPLIEVDELRAAVGARASLVSIDVADTGLPPAAPSPAAAFTAPTFGSTASAPARGEVAAVRRSPARAGATDLFAAATADHDDGVSTSASSDPQLIAPPAHDAEKPLGARNENSVLFSLSSLTAPSAGLGASPSGAASADASGLIDMQMLAGSGSGPKPPSPSKKVDDIMSLGGGAFVPTLAAPVLAPPSLGASDDAAPSGARSSGGMSMGTVVGIVAVTLAAAASGVFLYLRQQPQPAPPAPTATAVVAPAAPTATATALVAAPTATAAPVASATAAPAATTVDAVKPPPAATVLVPGAAPTPPPAAAKVEPAKAAAPTPAAPAAPPSPPTGVATPPTPAPAAPAEAPADGAQFDRAAAMTALGSAAGAAQSCRKPDGPTGSGRIAVTFAPSGAVTSAQVEGPPFAGTAVGGCVAARFRSARVPAFSGGTVTVHKSFSIN